MNATDILCTTIETRGKGSEDDVIRLEREKDGVDRRAQHRYDGTDNAAA